MGTKGFSLEDTLKCLLFSYVIITMSSLTLNASYKKRGVWKTVGEGTLVTDRDWLLLLQLRSFLEPPRAAESRKDLSIDERGSA